MSPNLNIVARQRPSCSAATQAKAQRLEVLNINRREAIIAGQHADYVVSFDTLTCSCRAGQDGLHCSHVLCALIERSRMAGYDDITFYDDRLDAKVACVAHLKAGRKARVVEDNTYIFVEVQSPPPQREARRYAAYNAATGRFDVMVGGVVMGQASSYLEAEATND